MRTALLIWVICLGGCVAAANTTPLPQPLPVAREDGCRLSRAASYSLVPAAAGRPVIVLALNGQAHRMQVDSGAEVSVLTDNGAETLGLAPGPQQRVQVGGLGGTGGYGTVRLGTIGFGGQTLRGLDLAVMRLSGADDLTGLIGADLLSAYQVEIDPGLQRLTLSRAYDCATVSPSWFGRAVALDWVGVRPLPVVRMRLDGRWVRALIDTGASGSAVGAAQVGLTTEALAADRPSLSFGAGNLAMAGRLHRFGGLSLGALMIPAPVLRVVTLDPAVGIDAVIGMDVLAGRRLWLDYGGRRIFIGLDQGAW